MCLSFPFNPGCEAAEVRKGEIKMVFAAAAKSAIDQSFCHSLRLNLPDEPVAHAAMPAAAANGHPQPVARRSPCKGGFNVRLFDRIQISQRSQNLEPLKE